MDIEEARLRLAEHPPKGDPTAMPGETLDEKATRLGGNVQSCRSEDGITVGLADALIGIVRVLAPRDLSTKNVQEALADLFQDPDFRTIQDAWKVSPDA